MSGKAVHIHPDVFKHPFGYKNEGNKRITLAVAETRVRMLRVKGYRYKKKGRERKEGLSWDYMEPSHNSFLNSCLSELLQPCPFKLLPTLFSQGRGRCGNEDRAELTV